MKIGIAKPPKIDGYPIDTNDYYPFVEDFVDTLKNKDLSIFYNNIRTAKIKGIKKEELSSKTNGAEYDINNNIIHYDIDDYLNYIMHELLHMSSTIHTDKLIISGFMQADYHGYAIGIGLNEGYTEFLNDRYFLNYGKNKDGLSLTIYPYTKMVVEQVELLIGKEHMEELYFKGDLYSLLDELSYYSSKKKTMRFLNDMDTIYLKGDNVYYPNIPVILSKYSRIAMYLTECFMTKFLMMKNEGLLNEDEYNKSMEYAHYIMKRRICYFRVLKSRKIIKYYDGLKEYVNKKVNRN